MDVTALVVAIIGAVAIVIPAYWSRKAAKQTRPVNGQTVSEQVDQLHRLFVVHDEADSRQFGELKTHDGALAEKILEVHDYNRNRWHKDDSRYAVTLALIATLADDDLTPEQKSERFAALQRSAADLMRWNGMERRHEEDK